jgi:hypothetical protein
MRKKTAKRRQKKSKQVKQRKKVRRTTGGAKFKIEEKKVRGIRSRAAEEPWIQL